MDDYDEFAEGDWPLASWQWDVIGVAVGIVVGVLAGIAVAWLI